MASGTAAPSLFLRNATGLVKGWSGFDAFRTRSCGSTSSRSACSTAWRCSPTSPRRHPCYRSSSRRSRSRSSPSPTGLMRGHAASRRRLRLADARPRRDPRHRDRGRNRRRRAVSGRECDRPERARVDRGRRRPRPGRVHRQVAGRHRVRPGSHGLVVHPRDVGADLRRHPQARVLPAALRAARTQRRRRLLRIRHRDAGGLPHRDRADVVVGRPWHGGLRPHPADLPLRPDRLRRDGRPDARVVPGPVQDRLRHGEPAALRRRRRVRQDHRRRCRERCDSPARSSRSRWATTSWPRSVQRS